MAGLSSASGIRGLASQAIIALRFRLATIIREKPLSVDRDSEQDGEGKASRYDEDIVELVVGECLFDGIAGSDKE
jgi:hypothetical protein